MITQQWGTYSLPWRGKKEKPDVSHIVTVILKIVTSIGGATYISYHDKYGWFTFIVIESVLHFSLGFMGYAPEMYELIWHHKVENTDDDQLYYTNLYLDQDVRVSHISNIKRITKQSIYV